MPRNTNRPLPALLRARDPATIRRFYRAVSWLVDKYFRCEFIGMDNLPEGPSLLVGTHNGAMTTPDAYALQLAYWRRFGIETPLYSLVHEVAFSIPIFGDLLARGGGLPANPESARVALEAGSPLLVYPGGDLDALKPFSDRHRITFGGRRGFIRAALRHQVPIVPVISVGAHEVLYVLNDGRKLARWLGIDRALRIKSVPLALSFPFGLTPAGLPMIPLPSKVVLQALPAIELAEPPSAAGDDAVVRRCYDHVVGTMQRALDQLAAARRFPLLG